MSSLEKSIKKEMKKGQGFLKEFKEFISKGNVIDLAVGVIIGGAFKGVVDSLTANIIQPLIDCVGGADIQGKIQLIAPTAESDGVFITYGAFISSVINFIIMAFVVFLLVKTVNRMMSIGKKPEVIAEEAPTTKECPFCKSEINIDATRCPNCTSVLEEVEK